MDQYTINIKDNNDKFKNRNWLSEFQTIKKHSPILSTTISSQHPDDNRYSNVLAADISLVMSDPYMHANWVCGYLITQGVLESDHARFWQMILDHKIENIVMLTQLMERDQEKCSLYYPLLNTETYGDIKVKLIKVSYINKDLTLRTLKVNYLTVHHYHYHGWNDFSTPSDVNNFVQLIKLVPHHRVCVHCSAGVGRSGVFVTIHQLIFNILYHKKEEINIVEFILNLRKQRSNMVQTVDQLEFIYRTIDKMIRIN